MSRTLGRAADLGAPAPVLRAAIQLFVRAYGVDLSEADVPTTGFRTFDELFTRRLRSGVRPLDPDPAAVLSPADGRLEDLGPVDAGATFRIKGRLYEVGEILGDPAEAHRYDGGSFFVVYLAPGDYHRVHAPVGGPVVRARHVPGTLFPVNEIGTTHVPRLFARNERVAVFQDSEVHGEVATVLVGAMSVGRIAVTFDDIVTNRGNPAGVRRYGEAAPPMERGEEIGVFHLGSTVIVFVGPEQPLAFEKARGAVVRVGEAIARKVGP